VACVDFSYHTTIYDWAGKNTSLYQLGENSIYAQSAVSPAGGRFFISSPIGPYPNSYTTVLVKAGTSLQTPYLSLMSGARIENHIACSWIDEVHLLAPTAVITIQPDAGAGFNVPAGVTGLASTGVCAGRFPGGL
jgi:hypothetical protein